MNFREGNAKQGKNILSWPLVILSFEKILDISRDCTQVDDKLFIVLEEELSRLGQKDWVHQFNDSSFAYFLELLDP